MKVDEHVTEYMYIHAADSEGLGPGGKGISKDTHTQRKSAQTDILSNRVLTHLTQHTFNCNYCAQL